MHGDHPHVEGEAAEDFAGLMEHIRVGSEVLIESGKWPLAIVRPTALLRRNFSEMIRLLDASSAKLGYTPAMDADFAADMEEIIQNRKPRELADWGD